VTLKKIQQSFYWPKLSQFITEKIATCPICQISKSEHVPYPGLLHPLPIPTQKWADVSMDFIQGLPKSRGKEVILVVVDRLTKYAHFIPLAHPYSVQTVADAFMNTIIKLHGPPASIVSDRDSIFTSHLWKQLFSKFKTQLNYSTAYHPESDGQTEQVNQCLEQYLRCMAFQQPKKWCDWLAAAEWWYNCSYYSAIQMSPFQALYEYSPPLLQNIPVPLNESRETLTATAEKENMVTLLQQNLLKAQTRMKKYADAKRTDRTFAVGDFVYLKSKPYRETALGMHNRPKFTPRWYEPFMVLKRVGTVAYQLPDKCKLHDVFHVSHLKKHQGPTVVPNPTLPLVTGDGKLKVAPLAVLQRRIVPRSAGEYDVAAPQWLIHWEGMTADEATWEDATHQGLDQIASIKKQLNCNTLFNSITKV
jgi:hypothetical protein